MRSGRAMPCTVLIHCGFVNYNMTYEDVTPIVRPNNSAFNKNM